MSDYVNRNDLTAPHIIYAGPPELCAALAASEARVAELEADAVLRVQQAIANGQAAQEARAQVAELRARCDGLAGVLSEVAEQFTRDDDLPNNLLPRIDAILAEPGAQGVTGG